MNITAKQKKILWICLIVFVGSYFARYTILSTLQMVNIAQRAMQPKPQPKPKAQEPKPADIKPVSTVPAPVQTTLIQPAPEVATAPMAAPVAQAPAPTVQPPPQPAAPVAPPPPPVKPPPTADPKLLGVWRGRSAIDGRGYCDVRLEVKASDDSTSELVAGFASMVCRPTAALAGPKRVNPKAQALDAANQEAAIMTGTPQEDGSIHFKTDKLINTDSTGCAFKAATLTAFGASFVAEEWQEEAPCHGGKSIMQRAGR